MLAMVGCMRRESQEFFGAPPLSPDAWNEMGKLTQKGLAALLKKPPKRHPDGDGLFFKTAGQGKAYWTAPIHARQAGARNEFGAVPRSHARRGAHQAPRTARRHRQVHRPGRQPQRQGHARHARRTPTFGHCADQFIALNEGGWKNSKHHAQWVATLKTYAAPIRDLPVDQVDTKAILNVLTPIWNDKPETASRLRGRIEKVLASAQVGSWIPEDRSNPAPWKNWQA